MSPFVITTDVGNISFEVKCYSKNSSATRKYTNSELYLLPPALLSSTLLDKINQSYLSSRYTHIANPLMGLMKTELYNEEYLQSSHFPVSTTLTNHNQKLAPLRLLLTSQ